MTSLRSSDPAAPVGGEHSAGRWGEVSILITCSLNNFLIFGTFSALNVAVPAMARDLDGGVTTASWIVLGFLLSNASTTILFAKLSDEWGRRWFYFGGILLFTLTSVGCAVVEDDLVLIVLRVLQGFGAAASMSTSSAVISDVFPPSRLPMALGLFMAIAGVSTLVGPLVGGLLVDHFGWRSIFWVAVALGVAAAAFGWGALKNVHSPGVTSFRLDLPGTITSTAGIAALIASVQLLSNDRADRLWVAAAAVAGVGLLTVFVRVERRSPHPLVDPEVVAGSRGPIYLAALCAAIPSGGLSVVVTLYLQVVVHTTASVAGLYLLPMGVAMLVGSLGAGLVHRWVSSRTANVAGALGLALAGVLVTLVIALQAPLWTLAATLLLHGLAQGIYQASLSARLLVGVAANRRGMAQGLRATIMNGGNALSTAMVFASVTLIAGPRVIDGGASSSARPAFIVATGLLALFGIATAVLTHGPRRTPREDDRAVRP